MKAAFVRQPGPPESIEYGDLPDPKPTGKQLLVRVKAVAVNPIDTYVRAVPGGLGEAKTAANYAASLYAAEEAKHAGFTQVLWLDGDGLHGCRFGRFVHHRDRGGGPLRLEGGKMCGVRDGVGISAATIALKVGTPALPLGAAKT